MKAIDDSKSGRASAVAFAMAAALAAPFVARWIAGLGHGGGRLDIYLADKFFILGWSLVHALTLLVLGRVRTFPFAVFCIAAVVSIAFVAFAHAGTNVTAGSTAVLALVFIPIWAAVGAAGIWLVLGLVSRIGSRR